MPVLDGPARWLPDMRWIIQDQSPHKLTDMRCFCQPRMSLRSSGLRLLEGVGKLLFWPLCESLTALLAGRALLSPAIALP